MCTQPKFCLLLIVIFFRIALFSQNETSKWYFGYHAGIDFMTNPPTVLNNGATNSPYCGSSIADGAGNLLFYTDGDTIWNASHAYMANGAGLVGAWSNSDQAVLIVKQPGNSSKYYVFSENGFDYGANGNGLKYAIVDMSLASGQGSVTTKNVIVDTTASTGKLAATNHCNGKDVWILTHDDIGNKFKAYLLTSAGLIMTPVISSVGQSGVMATFGQMKFSPNGRKLAYTASYTFEAYDFDNAGGIISNPVTLGGSFISSGCEFSPDGSKIYSTSFYQSSDFYQWDLCAGSNAAIIASVYHLTPQNQFLQGMQLAPDGKIYIAGSGNGLCVINNPNLAGAACNFTTTPAAFFWINAGGVLPNFNSSLFQPIVTTAFSHTVDPALSCNTAFFSSVQTNTTINCLNQGNAPNSISWTFGEPSSGASNSSSTGTPSHAYSAPGTYTVKLILSYNCKSDTVQGLVTIYKMSPTISVSATTLICLGQTATISASGASTYTWNNASAPPSMVVSPTLTTTYSVTGIDLLTNCSAHNMITVNVNACAGIEKLHNESGIKIYPVPASENITIDFNKEDFSENVTIQLITLLGEITTRNVRIENENSKMQIDIRELPKGIYFLQVFEKGKIIEVEKIIRE